MNNNVVAIILNYNDKNNTIRLAKCFEKYSIIDKIIVVDNCSPKNDIKYLMKLSSKKIDVILSDKNGGYSYGNNYALRYVEKNYGIFRYVIISNPDIEITEDSIKKTISYLKENSNIAIAAPRIYDQQGNKYILSGWKIRQIKDDIFLQSRITTKLFVKFPWKRMYDEQYQDKKYSVCNCVSGAFFIVKGDLFKKINYFDDRVFLFGEEDIIGKKFYDLGYKACVLNNCKVIHYESVSIKRSFDRPQTQKILYKSLRHYYKKYDETTNSFQIFLYDLVYLYGKLESGINRFLNNFSLFKRIKYYFKKVFHILATNKRLRKINLIPKNNKKNVLFITNYWEEELKNRKNLGIPSWVAHDLISNSKQDCNFYVLYALGNTYRLTSYCNGEIYSYVVGFFANSVKTKKIYYNKIINYIVKNLNIDLVQINTIINHYPSISDVLVKNKIPYFVSILDDQFFNCDYIYYNIDSAHESMYNKKNIKWIKSIQKLFDNSEKIIFDNSVALKKYKKMYDIRNELIINAMLNNEYMHIIKSKFIKRINIAFLGCINNKQELDCIKKLIRYSYKKAPEIDFYFIGNYNLKIGEQYSNVHCVGEYERDNLSNIIEKNNINLICFFKQHDYASSIVLYEAYFSGIPILSTDKSALYSNFINKNDCGWILDSSLSIDETLKKILDIFKNKEVYQSKVRVKFKKNNKIDEYYKLYCEVFNEKK